MFKVSGRTNLTEGEPIDSFKGLTELENELNLLPGQLVENQNMEYIQSGGKVALRTRRGSTSLQDLTKTTLAVDATEDAYWTGTGPFTPGTWVLTNDTELKISERGTLAGGGAGSEVTCIKFNITAAGLPANATITSVKLEVYCKATSAVGNKMEVAVTTAGGYDLADNDFAFEDVDASPPTHGLIDSYVGADSVAAGWVTLFDGDYTDIITPLSTYRTNLGFMIVGRASETGIILDSSTGANKPKLTVTYTVPAGSSILRGCSNYVYDYSNNYPVWIDGDGSGTDGKLKLFGSVYSEVTNTFSIANNRQWVWNGASMDNGITGTSFKVYWQFPSVYTAGFQFSGTFIPTGYAGVTAKLRFYVNTVTTAGYHRLWTAPNTTWVNSPYTYPGPGATFIGFITINSTGWVEIDIPISVITAMMTSNTGFIWYEGFSDSTANCDIDTVTGTNPPQLIITAGITTQGSVQTVSSNRSSVEWTKFFNYGAGGAQSTLYGTNSVDGIYKITGNPASVVPTLAAVLTAIKPVWLEYSNISGRMFAVSGHNIYYSRVNVTPQDTTNLDTWTGDYDEIFELNTVKGVWILGETVTGGTSAKTATIVYKSPDEKLLYIKLGTTSLTDGEAITGGASGATAIYRKSAFVVSGTKNLNYATVSPDSGSGFVCNIDDGQIHYFFKDTGIWALLNADDDPTNWYFPKLNAEVGTRSPRTVQYARLGESEGIIYLGSDKTLRYLKATTARNSGARPTLVGGDSKIISKAFSDVLETISDTYLTACNGYYWQRYYILNIPKDAASTINYTIIIDTERLMPLLDESEIRQPFHFTATNMEYEGFTTIQSTNQLYAFHKSLYLSRAFVNGLYTEGVPVRIDPSGTLAIPWSFYTGWNKVGNYEAELKEAYLQFESSNAITFTVNSFTTGKDIPNYNTGATTTITPSGTGDVLLATTLRRRGNYFSYGAYNSTKNQPATIYGIMPLFSSVRRHQLGKRK